MFILSLELVFFLVMVGVFILCAFVGKQPIGVSLAISAVAGAIVGRLSLDDGFRHLYEGSLSFFDIVLTVFAAIILMEILARVGTLEALSSLIISNFYRRPAILILLMMFLVMLPGALSGSASIAIITMGSLTAPVFLSVGIPKVDTAAIIALGGIAGMTAPPINLPAMIMGAGMDMPYIGLELPLLAMAFPAAIFSVYWIGLRHIKKMSEEDMEKHVNRDIFQKYGIRIYLPFLILIILMVLPRVGMMPDFGLALTFMLTALVGLFVGRKIRLFETLPAAAKAALPVMAILVGVGMFVQVMTATGARGAVVMTALSLPDMLFYIGTAISLPLFGAISSFGAATVLGVPIALTLLAGRELIIVSALSLVAGLGDLTPPTALAGIFAAQALKLDNYFPVLKKCLIPALFILIYGMIFVIYSDSFSFLL